MADQQFEENPVEQELAYLTCGLMLQTFEQL